MSVVCLINECLFHVPWLATHATKPSYATTSRIPWTASSQAPTSTTFAAPTTTTLAPPCSSGWTDWASAHTPDSQGDAENYDELANAGYRMCAKAFVVAMKCGIVENEASATESVSEGIQPTVLCSLNDGLSCKNDLIPFPQKCRNYAVKFYCTCPTGTTSTYPGWIFTSTKLRFDSYRFHLFLMNVYLIHFKLPVHRLCSQLRQVTAVSVHSPYLPLFTAKHYIGESGGPPETMA